MIQKAQKQFPQIDLARSIMVGDSITDIEMGLRAGMHTVFITTSSPDVPDHVDNAFDSLYAFAQYVVDA
jgi:histidinol phosphatase-like enzyme